MLSDFQSEKMLSEIRLLSEYTDLDESVIEKDLYVTHAISVVSKISKDTKKKTTIQDMNDAIAKRMKRKYK